MKHITLSYAFVGLWQNIGAAIPLLDRKFALDLFDDPYRTQAGLSLEGFVVALPSGKSVTPTVVIGPDRLQVTTDDLQTTLSVVSKVRQELLKTGFNFEFRGFGLNTEHVISEIAPDSGKWIFEKFLKQGISISGTEFEDASFSAHSIIFESTEPNGNKYVIRIEPRTNESNGLFVYVNDHRDGNMVIDDLSKQFEDSIDKIINKLFPIVNITL